MLICLFFAIYPINDFRDNIRLVILKSTKAMIQRKTISCKPSRRNLRLICYFCGEVIFLSNMNKAIVISVIAAAVLAFRVEAQEPVYLDEFRAVFEKADAEISEYYRTAGAEERITDCPGSCCRAFARTPVRIAIPDCPQAPELVAMVEDQGCIPVLLPGREGMENPTMELRKSSIGWDGVLMPEGWVSFEDEYSLLVYKTVTDWNVPYLGTSEATMLVDRGLRRLPCAVSDVAGLVAEAGIYRKARNLMEGIFTIDTHCDLPEGEGYRNGTVSVGKRNRSQCGIPKMDEGGLKAQVLISFLNQGPDDEEGWAAAVERNLRQISEIKADIESNSSLCGLATTPQEALALAAEGRKAFFIGLENAYGIGGDLANIRKMKELGITYITLCHFYDNYVCHTSSQHGEDPSLGLTPFGIKVVREMNRQGLMIDLSHPSEGTFWDCIKYSKAPVVCSHSGVKAVFGHDRGLDDSQLKALADKGGVIQIYTVPNFLRAEAELASIDDFMEHFNHAVEVAGPEHVGIGSDFDGGGGVIGLNGDNDMVNITVLMLKHGYTPEQIEGFWGGNFLRVMKEVQSLSGR